MFLQEIRYAVRMLVRSPGFTIVSAISLALGIGVNSALFSFHDAILLRPLPVRDPDSLVVVSAAGPEDASPHSRLSYPNYRDLHEKNKSFDGLIADQIALFSFARSRETTREMRMGILVSGNMCDVLGIRPMIGRGFRPEEGSVPGRDAVTVLGYDFWKNVLGGDVRVLNSFVLINGIDFTVIGVMPESFPGLDQFVRPQFYVPLMMTERLGSTRENPLLDRKSRAWEVRGRLKPGVTRRNAEEELAAIWKNLELQYPDANRDRTIAVRSELQQRILNNPPNAIIGAMMTVLAALVLIIACANVANLMLGRARSRSREMAVRLALGISRTRLLRQLLTESLLLALLAGVLGVGFGYAGIRLLAYGAQQVVPTDFPVVISAQLDLRVLVFTLSASAVSAVCFGLAPAWQSLKVRLVPALKSFDWGETRKRFFGRNVLVVAQVALSMVLLFAAGMVQGGFRRTLALDPGFRTDHLITMSLDTSFAHYTPAQTHDFYRNLVDRARALPGVRSVAVSDSLPFDRNLRARLPVMPEGYQFPQGKDNAAVPSAVVSEDYFETMQTRIIQGRAFTASDNDRSTRVAVVNEVFAATYWPNQNPIGKRMRLNDSQGPWVEVVGLAKTEKYSSILEPPTAFIYLPFAQQERRQIALLVQTASADTSSLATPLRDLVRALDVNQPVFSLRAFSAFYKQSATGPQILVMSTAAAMGLLGLTLALVGLYGLIAYSVERRTREIGVRIAIGAGKAQVLKMVLGQGMRLAIAGILVGALGCVAVAGLMTAAIAGLGAVTPVSYLVVPALLIGLTLLASYIPARRASRMDPLRALRYE